MVRHHANRLIAAAEVATNLEPMGSKLSDPRRFAYEFDTADYPLPENERQVRPLTRLAPDQQREKADRASKAWRLSKLGWTQDDIADSLGLKDRTSIYNMLKNSHLGKIQHDIGAHWNDKGIAEVANRLNLSLTDCYTVALEELPGGKKARSSLAL